MLVHIRQPFFSGDKTPKGRLYTNAVKLGEYAAKRGMQLVYDDEGSIECMIVKGFLDFDDIPPLLWKLSQYVEVELKGGTCLNVKCPDYYREEAISLNKKQLEYGWSRR